MLLRRPSLVAIRCYLSAVVGCCSSVAGCCWSPSLRLVAVSLLVAVLLLFSTVKPPTTIKLMLVSFCWETTEIQSLFSFYWCHISGLVLGLVQVFNRFASICICLTSFVGYKRTDSGTDLVSPEFESAESHVTRPSWALTPYIYFLFYFLKPKISTPLQLSL